MAGILKKTNYSAVAVGGLVEIKLGNVPITMDYDTCLDLAQIMRIVGRQARANVGGNAILPRFRAKGMLTDANEDELRHQGLRDSTAAFRNH